VLLKSSIVRLTCGVPQGSVLGPLLFVLYTADLMSLIEDNGYSPYLYAVTLRSAVLVDPSRSVEIDALSAKFSECIGVVSNWMRSNRLQINLDKTEVLWCTTGRRQHQLPTTALSIDGVQVSPVTSVRNLGIFIDSDRDAVACSMNSIGMLRCAPSTASDPQIGADGHVPIIGGRSGAI